MQIVSAKGQSEQILKVAITYKDKKENRKYLRNTIKNSESYEESEMHFLTYLHNECDANIVSIIDFQNSESCCIDQQSYENHQDLASHLHHHQSNVSYQPIPFLSM